MVGPCEASSATRKPLDPISIWNGQVIWADRLPYLLAIAVFTVAAWYALLRGPSEKIGWSRKNSTQIANPDPYLLGPQQGADT